MDGAALATERGWLSACREHLHDAPRYNRRTTRCCDRVCRRSLIRPMATV